MSSGNRRKKSFSILFFGWTNSIIYFLKTWSSYGFSSDPVATRVPVRSLWGRDLVHACPCAVVSLWQRAWYRAAPRVVAWPSATASSADDDVFKGQEDLRCRAGPQFNWRRLWLLRHGRPRRPAITRSRVGLASASGCCDDPILHAAPHSVVAWAHLVRCVEHITRARGGLTASSSSAAWVPATTVVPWRRGRIWSPASALWWPHTFRGPSCSRWVRGSGCCIFWGCRHLSSSKTATDVTTASTRPSNAGAWRPTYFSSLLS